MAQVFIALLRRERLPCACFNDSLQQAWDQNEATFWCFSTIWEKILISCTSLSMKRTEKLCQSEFGYVPLQDNLRCHHFHLLGPKYIWELISTTVFQTKNSAALLSSQGNICVTLIPPAPPMPLPLPLTLTNQVTGLNGIHNTLITCVCDFWCNELIY